MIRRMLIAFLFVVGSFQACGYMHAVDIQNAASLSSTTPISSALNFSSVSNEVFVPKCVKCHSGSSPAGNYNLSTYNGATSGGRIIPNDPTNSLLVQRMLDGTMPPGGGLSQEEISLVEDWIAIGAPQTTDNSLVVSAGPDESIQLPMVNYSIMGSATTSSGSVASVQWQQLSGPTVTLNGVNTLILTLTNMAAGTYVFELIATDNLGSSSADSMTLVISPAATAPTPTPSPTATPKSTPTPTPTPTATPNANAKYSLIYANILKPKCESCHDASAPGGLDVRTYSGTIKSVVPFNSAKSSLYTSVASGSMPKGSSKLSTSEIQAIKDWIDAGALNN